VTYQIRELLAAMDMVPDEGADSALVSTKPETIKAKQLAEAPLLEEIVALERAASLRADFVYFRRLPQGPILATAYLYDWTEPLIESFDAARDLDDLHRRLWSAGEVPLVFLFRPTEVLIFHVLKGPKADDRSDIKANPWETIKLAGDAAERLKKRKELSAWLLDSGRFLEEHPKARKVKLEGAAFMALSQELGECRKRLIKEFGLADPLVKRLLILFVMIKYLEERRDSQGRGAFPPGLFDQFAHGAQGFIDLLRAGGEAVLAFLDHLAAKDRFNGEVFELSPEERQAIGTTNLTGFADVLEGRLEGSQITLWRRYSFKDLPVELISHLYEQFLPDQPGVVYTPPFLVSFILDEVLPLSQSTPDDFRLLDPACGSGVFLVGAFKRLVHRWRKANDYRQPGVMELKRLIRDHLFGVDLQGEALRLTLFSLSVALCDFLEPRRIWDELHFDPLLGTNLIEGDFFAQVKERGWKAEPSFDLIVGNPPFISKLTPAGSDEVQEISKAQPGFELPYKQVSLLFLETAMKTAKPDGEVALIQPSGPFLYNENSEKFRRLFLERYHVPQIVDLTHLSRVLFRRKSIPSLPGTKKKSTSNPADVAVAVVFAQNCAPNDSPLLHVTIRRTVQAEQKLMFEIDHYDLHFVPRREAIENPGIWKANFIGGGRIPHLLRRLGRMQTLGGFLKKKRREGWDFGEGYKIGNEVEINLLVDIMKKKELEQLSIKEQKELTSLQKKYKNAPWLTGHLTVPTDSLTTDGIDWGKVVEIEKQFFERPRRESLFSGPLLLIKEVVESESEKIPTVILADGLKFKRRIFGIHAPISDLEFLKNIQSFMEKNRLVRFHLLATSADYLIARSSAFGSVDILRLPFPDSPEELHLSPLEEALIDDVLDHAAEYKRKGDQAAVAQPPTTEQLHQFGDLFCKVLGSVYQSLKSAEPVPLKGGICYPFYFGDEPSEPLETGDLGAAKLEALLTQKVGSSLRCQRVLRVFHGNMLLLVKPPQLRYWLRSIAVRDADELFAELQELGY
jgi:hypothetical protein